MTLNKSGSTLEPFWVYKPIIFPATGTAPVGGPQTQPCVRAEFITQKINQRQAVNTTLSPALKLFILFAALYFKPGPSEKLASPIPESNLWTPSVESWKLKKAKTNICPPQLGKNHLLAELQLRLPRPHFHPKITGWVSVEGAGGEVESKSGDSQNGTQIQRFYFYYYIFISMSIRRNYCKYIQPWDLKYTYICW